MGLDEIMFAKDLALCLAHSKYSINIVNVVNVDE